MYPGFREIQAADFGRVTEILNSYLQGYKLRQQFTEAEVRHFLTPQKDLVYVYVVEGEDRSITDVCSFYCLPSSILHHPQHKELKAAYMCAASADLHAGPGACAYCCGVSPTVRRHQGIQCTHPACLLQVLHSIDEDADEAAAQRRDDQGPGPRL